jgi:hypothetical protein
MDRGGLPIPSRLAIIRGPRTQKIETDDTMNTRTLSLLLVFIFCGANLAAQDRDNPLQLRGGSWKFRDKTIEIGPEIIGRHVETLRRLSPRQPREERLRAAWQRAFRVESARSLGLGEDEEAFLAWMTEAHRSLQSAMTNKGELTRASLEEFARERGFSSLAAYEDFCRDEYRSRCLIDMLEPPRPITEEMLRQRFDAMGTEMLVDALAIGPETLDDTLIPDPSDEKAREAYRNWFARLPESYKLTFDDRDHPALEAEAIYVNFRNRSPEEFHAWFTKANPELEGRSLDEVTAELGIEPTEDDEGRIYRRWVEHRRANLSFVNAGLPSGLSDRESYPLVRPYLIEVWKTIRYLEVIWNDLRTRPNRVSFADEARRRGLSFRHIPMQVRWSFDNDPVLPGDHSQPLLKKTEVGDILDYNTGARSRKDSAYFAEGVVDQPGLHASIFRLIRREPMRVRQAEEVLERAWPAFVAYGRWQAAQQVARVTARNWKNLLVDEAKKMQAAGEAEDEVALRKRAFARLSRNAPQCELVERIHVKPFGDRRPRAKREASLGRRLQSFIEWRWQELAKAGPEGAYHPGLVLDFVIDLDYRVAALVRIRAIRRPRPEQWERDRGLRQRALESLREDADKRRLEIAQERLSVDKLREEFSLRAPDLDAKPEGK